MGRKLLTLFSHNLTDSQKGNIKSHLDIKDSNIIELTEDLKQKFSSVPAELDSIREFSEDFIDWIDRNASKDDYVLIQGDYGVTFLLVDFCLKHHYIPIYATTERVQQEEKNPDGSVLIKKFFKHKRFRRYETWPGPSI